VAEPLWQWAGKTHSAFRQIIDARLAFTLRHHGVTHFATANQRHFREFGFKKVWNPL
jgi:predicted nucleic acid-binding protein